MQPTHARWEAVGPGDATIPTGPSYLTNGISDEPEKVLLKNESIFPKLDPVYPRNFMIHDVHFESAPDSGMVVPGTSVDTKTLASIADDILEELPPECRQAFDEARTRETEWRSQWSTEATDGRRAHFLPATAWYP